jgi:hypothetical protein
VRSRRGRVGALEDFADGLSGRPGQAARGKSRLAGDLAAGDAEGAGEGEPLGVDFCLVGGFGHELADGWVTDFNYSL